MANRYWVGGTATWDTTAGTKWSLTSGGAGGETVPTTNDDVFFDANSGANTITFGGSGVSAKSMNCTGFTGTLQMDTPMYLNNSGSGDSSVTIVTGMSVTGSNKGINWQAGSGTFATAGKTFGTIVGPSSSSYTLTVTGTNATFANLTTVSTGIIVLTGLTLNITGALTSGAITVTSATLNFSGTGTVINHTTGSWTGGSSCTINISADSASMNLGNQTIGTLNLNGLGSGVYYIINGTGTITTLNMPSPTGAKTLYFQGSQTTNVTTFNVNGYSPDVRTKISSASSIGVPTTATHTLNKSGGATTRRFLEIEHSIGTPGSTWYAVDSVDNNSVATAGSGWNISKPPHGLFGGSNY